MSDLPSVSNPPAPSRWLLVGSAVALVVLLVVNVPPFLHTALDCDPILFDLYARDMVRGGVLYRDMVENNTPTMIVLQLLIRDAFGHSTAALRIVDLLVVGLGVGLLARWFRPGRPDLHLFAFTLTAVIYLTTTEWCHVQRDVWLLLPVMGGLYLRRAQLHRSTAGRTAFGWALLEGLVWGLAVWLKPYALVMAAAVWFSGLAWARSRGANRSALLADFAGLFLGGALLGAAGVGAMHAFGIWVPYVDHLTNWGSEYRGADMYGKLGPWFFRLGYLLRNAPWSLIYLLALPAALVQAVRPVWVRWTDDRPDRALLSALLVSWAFQACILQHVFDYPHIAGEMFAVVLLIDFAIGLRTDGHRRIVLIALALMKVIGHAPVFIDRVQVWGECIRFDDRPQLRDKLARYERIGWTELDRVAQFLREQGVKPGEVNVIGDTALPLWEMLDQTPPTRYYIVQNNLLSFHSRNAEIKKTLSEVPNQRYLVCDHVGLRSEPPPGYSWRDNRADWPLRADWYGPSRWADRIVFRSGRYVVIAMPAADVPRWMDEMIDK